MNNDILHKKIFCNIPTIKTERLILRKIAPCDAKDIYEYARVPEVSRYTLWTPHKNVSDSAKFINFVKRNYRSCKAENWGIVHKQDNKFIGTIGYFNWDEINRKAEIHYALSNKYSGLGLMTEAARAVINFGFKKMRLNRVAAKCMVKNKASERVMQKCGMRFEGIMRRGLFVKGKYVDLKVYAVLKSDRI